jgi:hypothetical protein
MTGSRDNHEGIDKQEDINSSKRPVKFFQIHGAFLERVVLRRENLETRVMTLKVAIIYQ